MPKLYLYLAGLAAALAGALGPAAAQTLPSPGPRTCATPQATAAQQAQLVRRVPGYRARLATTRDAPRPQGAAAVTYTLPVVVHIISSGEAVGTGTNLSQAQVQSQLAVLNEDYRNRNADGALVPGVFQFLRGDAQFQFQLAGIDPSGRLLTEPGIDRIDRTARGWDAPPYGSPGDVSYIESVIKPQTSWNPDNYVNIWVMSLGNNLLGYAQLPDNTANLGGLYPQGGLAATDGVVIQYSAFGRVGTLAANYDRGRTTTHEMGHFLGLRHTWGDADCGDDYVADTPPQQSSNFGCPAFPHVSCSNGPNGDLFMDFLDYVNDACMQLFTRDQTDRMQAVLAAGTPRRSTLPASPALCLNRVAATAANSGLPCAGGGALYLTATGPAGATYAWSGPNNFSSSQQNPVLPGATAALGTYTVLVTGLAGSCPALATTTVGLSPPVWTGAAGDGDWFNAANWQGCVPTRTTDALIPVLSGVPYPTITGGAAEVRTLTVQGELNVRGGSLALYGDLGGLGLLAQTGGQVVTLGLGAQSLRGGAYLDLVIGGAGTKTIGSATIGQRLLLSGGLLSTGRDSLTLGPTATLSGETDASYVLGQLRTTRAVAPGSTETFGNLGVSVAASFAPGATTVRRVTGTALASGGNVGTTRYYDIRPAASRGLQGATLSLTYLPHELNGLSESTLALFRLPPGGAPLTNEGATTRDASAHLVTRAYVTDLAGRWTLASSTTPLALVSNALTIQAFPVPFTTGGLSLQVTTPAAGPLSVQVFDVLGRRLFDHAVANVEVGTSTVNLPGTEQLSPGKYLVRVQQAGQQVRLQVVRN